MLRRQARVGTTFVAVTWEREGGGGWERGRRGEKGVSVLSGHMERSVYCVGALRCINGHIERRV